MGKAIIIEDANFEGNNLGQASLLEPMAKNLYEKHLADSGRPEDLDLLRTLNKLVLSGLYKKIKSFYWLASSRDNANDIRFNIFNSSDKLTLNGAVLVSANGATPVSKGFLIDPASYNLAYGFTAGFVIPQASTLANSLEWGANGASQDNANFIASKPYGTTLARRGAAVDIVTTTDDNTAGGGVYIYTSNKNGEFIFKHNEVLVKKTASKFGLMVNPTVLKFKDIESNTTNAVVKVYLTMSENLTELEVNKLEEILR